MNRAVSPTEIAPPAANYVHAVLSDHPSRLLHTSGVVPVRADGSVPDDIEEQAAVVWPISTQSWPTPKCSSMTSSR